MFIVIITTMITSIIVASFIKLINRDYTSSSTQDLSQSAYDSAQAGVEDAKRFLAKYELTCFRDTKDAHVCEKLNTALHSSKNSCNALYAEGYGVGSGNGETVLSSSTSSNEEDLNQAYTCLKIQKDSSEFLGEVDKDDQKIIPLKASSPYNKIVLSWHSDRDGEILNLDPLSGNLLFPKESDWGGRPAAIKAQFIGDQPGRSSLSDLNTNFSDDGIGIDEQVYYPVKSTISHHANLPSTKRTGNNAPEPAGCMANMSTKPYACKIEIKTAQDIPREISSYMIISPLYRKANFKIELFKDNTLVSFEGVQPIVDSTGRANYQFRRVESRVEMTDYNSIIPNYAVQIDGNAALCKNFYVTRMRNNIQQSGCKK